MGRGVNLTLGGVLAALLLATSVAQSAAKPYETSNGRRLDLPPIQSLNCAQAARWLAIIDATNYRPVGPKPPADPRDVRVYRYEEALSGYAMRKCRKRKK